MQVRIKSGIDSPVLRVSAGSNFAHEFRTSEAPWDLGALAAEWAGPRGNDEEPEQYEARLGDHGRRLQAILEGTGLFEISD